MLRLQQIRLPLDYTDTTLKQVAAKELRITPDQISAVELVRRSLDARKKQDIHYSAILDVQTAQEKIILKKCKKATISAVKNTFYQYPKPGEQKLNHRPVIAGSGPAGLFCGLILARCGYQPLILERGENMEKRSHTVQNFWDTGKLDPKSNVQFGEGGAGTFSDGKLNTMVKDREGRSRFVLETFVNAGAHAEILYVNKPHIGTDILQNVVKNIRLEIERLGGEVRFGAHVTELETENGRMKAVIVNKTERIDCQIFVAAIGHSARDTFAMLTKHPLRIEPKPFAVGVRVEHPQEMINRSQYGIAEHSCLAAADYKLTAKLSDGRGIYSFCMCPGGYVVNASSEKGMLAVNGMSYHARDSRNANSAIVLTVTPQDFGSSDVLAGVEFQRKLEKMAYQVGNGQIPAQLFGDFCQKKESTAFGEVFPCTKGACRLTNLREALPEFIGNGLEEGILQFEKKITGFARKDALLLGVESRTSSPVRIARNESRMAELFGFYPCGEGAGYAGGITSAAMDGIKTAEAIVGQFSPIH